MQEPKFQLWIGRWQQQDAVWRAGVEDGAWRLRPLGSDEVTSFSKVMQPALEVLHGKSDGLPYVLVVRLRSEFSTRVPLFPRAGNFWTLNYYLRHKGKPEKHVEVKTEELPETAEEVYESFSGEASRELAGLTSCQICKNAYVTGDPIIRFRHRRTKDMLSAHFLCGVVKSADVIGHVIGMAIYIAPDDRLNMPPEKMEMLDRAAQLVYISADPEFSASQSSMEKTRRDLHSLCREINSTTPYRDSAAAVALLEPLRPWVSRLVDSLTDSVVNSRRPIEAAALPGRNEPCPCGSGDKYKRCCATA